VEPRRLSQCSADLMSALSNHASRAVTRRLTSLEKGYRSRQEFAGLYAWVHSLEPEWWTTAITFQRGPEWIKFSGVRWRVQLSFFGTRWGWTRNSHIRYSVSVSVSPGDDLSPVRRQQLRRSGSLDDVVKVLARLGYRGTWHPKGCFGHFMKDFRNQRQLREEMSHLEGVTFKTILGDVGRRTTR
jgi:hypothetical protein